MARKLMKKLGGDSVVNVKLYRDIEWEEYQIEVWYMGFKNVEGMYYTTDLQDAYSTMDDMYQRAIKTHTG